MNKIKINKKKLNSLRGVALVLVLATPFSLIGCGKKVECSVNGNHAHMYKNEAGYVRYIENEHLSYEGYARDQQYISIEGEEELYKFLNKKNLMRIDDNLEIIKETQEKQDDYMEYRYKYTYMQPIPHHMKVGKVTTTYFTYMPVIRYSWTSDSNRSSLTGETRMCHYLYGAYKIEKDEQGKYVLVSSPYVDDLTTVMDEYPYIKKDYYKIVTLDGKEVDYEDGKQEDLSAEDQKRAEEYEATLEEESSVNSKSYTR